jgi:hypothetical protein
MLVLAESYALIPGTDPIQSRLRESSYRDVTAVSMRARGALDRTLRCVNPARPSLLGS